jgi:hypothetical protein
VYVDFIATVDFDLEGVASCTDASAGSPNLAATNGTVDGLPPTVLCMCVGSGGWNVQLPVASLDGPKPLYDTDGDALRRAANLIWKWSRVVFTPMYSSLSSAGATFASLRGVVEVDTPPRVLDASLTEAVPVASGFNM